MMKWYVFFVLMWSVGELSSRCDTIPDPSVEEVKLMVKKGKTSIMLRWAPTTPGLWLKMQKARILVYRNSWEVGKVDVTEDPVLVSDTLRVWPEARFSDYVNEEGNEYLMLAGYVMYAPYESIRGGKPDMKELADREMELANRFSTALMAAERDADAAHSLALRFDDTKADVSKMHAYSLVVILRDGTILQDVALFDPTRAHAFRPELAFGEEAENTVVLSWDKALHEAHYSSYWVEKSSDGTNYERLTKAPYVHAYDAKNMDKPRYITYIDSVENYVPYHYRFIGLDAFGEASEPSASMVLMGRDKTPPPTPKQPMAEMNAEGVMEITWQMEETTPDLSGFFIGHAQHFEGPYSDVSQTLTRENRKFMHIGAAVLATNFYKICAVDTAGNKACTAPVYGSIVDTIPPQKPTGLQGKIDSNGVVYLSWDAPLDVDVEGYNVYFSNRYDGVFSILNQRPVPALEFTDTITLHTLTENIFYRITAVDARSNVSPFSDMAVVQKPDTIPPGPPVFVDYENTDEGITLKWKPSSSRDVVRHELYRQEGETQKILLAEPDLSTTTYCDTTLFSGGPVRYELAAVDDSGLRTFCPEAIILRPMLRKQTAQVEIRFVETMDGESEIKVNTPSDPTEIQRVIIYRAIDSGPFLSWKSLAGAEVSTPLPTASEKAKIKARIFYKNGSKSDYSNVISLSAGH